MAVGCRDVNKQLEHKLSYIKVTTINNKPSLFYLNIKIITHLIIDILFEEGVYSIMGA